jgi:hypothetical protein
MDAPPTPGILNDTLEQLIELVFEYFPVPNPFRFQVFARGHGLGSSCWMKLKFGHHGRRASRI